MASITKVVVVSVAWALAGLLFYAGILKLLQPAALLADIQSYNLVSYRLAYVGAYVLPGVEIAAAIGLLFKGFRVESAGVVAVLMIIFIIALASAWLRGVDVTCGCFGKSETQANYPLLIGRDLLLLAGAAFVFYRADTSSCRF